MKFSKHRFTTCQREGCSNPIPYCTSPNPRKYCSDRCGRIKHYNRDRDLASRRRRRLQERGRTCRLCSTPDGKRVHWSGLSSMCAACEIHRRRYGECGKCKNLLVTIQVGGIKVDPACPHHWNKGKVPVILIWKEREKEVWWPSSWAAHLRWKLKLKLDDPLVFVSKTERSFNLGAPRI